MLFGLVLAFAACVSAGEINIRQVSKNEVGLIDGSPLSRLFEIYDSGDAVLNGINLVTILKDLGKSSVNKAATYGQAVAVLGEAATGRYGDVCAEANYVNAYTRYVNSGKTAGVREALARYIKALSTKIDNIATFVSNKEKARFATGVTGGCANGGRAYQFDAAWDVILGSAPQSISRLVNEEYCVVKRMYCGFSALNNNLAASTTAAALPPTEQLFRQAAGPLSNFIQSAAVKSNIGPSAAALKRALSSGLSNVKL